MASARAQLSVLGRPLDKLPLELTSFIGREREVAELRYLLGAQRLLTLCGSGGSGKTRLALEVAQEVVEHYDDVVWWVDLAAISDPKLVPFAVATALGCARCPTVLWPHPSPSIWNRGDLTWFWTTASTSSTEAPRWPTHCAGDVPT
jgi:hypothetical protein